MRLIGYLRVSTDDKNQDPERQRPVLEGAARKSGDTITGWVVDEGTRAGDKGPPTLDRPRLKELLALAKETKADGIMVESVDRWTRKGSSDLGYSMFVLERDHGLKLMFADTPDDPIAREVIPPLMAFLARMDNKRRSDQARSSAARKKAMGVRVGRPPKPDLDPAEFQAAIAAMTAGGGYRKAALAVSSMRGAADVSDAKARRARMVSASWVADQLAKRPETPGLLGRVVRPCHAPPSRNGPIPEQPVEA